MSKNSKSDSIIRASPVRSRCWAGVAYPSPADLFRLEHDSHIVHYAFALHDKDEKDGVPVAPHYHFVVTFSEGLSFHRALFWLQRNVFISGCNIQLDAVKNRLLSFEYLWHKNDPEKHQYNPDDVCCDSARYWRSTDEAFHNSENRQFIEDLATLSVVELALKYGRDFIKNCGSYMQFRQWYLHDWGEDDDLD